MSMDEKIIDLFEGNISAEEFLALSSEDELDQIQTLEYIVNELVFSKKMNTALSQGRVALDFSEKIN